LLKSLQSLIRFSFFDLFSTGIAGFFLKNTSKKVLFAPTKAINMQYTLFSKNGFSIVLIFALLVYTVGAFLYLMEPDATCYALVSMEMYQNLDFINIQLRGEDWLDKPHFQFWVTAISYFIFGVNDFGYRFPSLLIFLMGVYYTYLFGKKFYNAQVGQVSAILLMTALHIIISTSDVRAELILLGFTIFSLYYVASFLEDRRIDNFILACLGMGILMMTKGVFTVIPIAGAVGLQLIFSGKWKAIFQLQWLWMILLSFLFTLPTVLAYYLQFDMHPEKEVFGRTGVSGVWFFFWDSQWGRFANSGPIQGQGELAFFLHTMLWAFAPWAFLAYYALFQKIRQIIQKKDTTENYTLYAFLSMFLIFSVSKFQLPHYLNPIFPMLAIAVAHQLVQSFSSKTYKVFQWIQGVQVFILILALGLMQYFFKATWFHWDTSVVLLLSLGAIFYVYLKESSLLTRVVIPSALVILMVGYYLNRDFYPDLFAYQSETQVAFYIQKNKLEESKLATHQVVSRSTDFYLKRTNQDWNAEELQKIRQEDWLVFTDSNGLETLKKTGKEFQILHTFVDFHITTLNPEFINQKTREKALNNTYLLRVLHQDIEK
jgi:4-amino-4-deoxy-L-arabinose transferase-like glycosyltransferase